MLLKRFPVEIPQLLSNKKIIPFRVQASFLFEIFTGETNGYFFEKIVKYIVAAVGLGNQPAINILIAMGVTEDLEAIKKLPAWLPFLCRYGLAGCFSCNKLTMRVPFCLAIRLYCRVLKTSVGVVTTIYQIHKCGSNTS